MICNKSINQSIIYLYTVKKLKKVKYTYSKYDKGIIFQETD